MLEIDPDEDLVVSAEYLNRIVESASESKDLESISQNVFESVQEWARLDYEASAEWLLQQPPSLTRDYGIEGSVESVSRIDGEAATLWATQIQNETKRKKAIDEALNAWRKEMPEAARAWEETSRFSAQ